MATCTLLTCKELFTIETSIMAAKLTNAHIFISRLVVTLSVLWIDKTLTDNVPYVDVAGIEGNHVSLKCAADGLGLDERLEWVDYVYNSSPEPEKIFHTDHHGGRHKSDSHPNAENYKVNSHYTLKISQLNQDSTGRYVCRAISNSGDRRILSNYYLSVATKPKCYGETKLREKDRVDIVCNMSYSGSQPDLHWLRDNERVDSVDRFQIRKAEKVIELRAKHGDDKAVYRCDVTLGDMTESCSLTLDVSYHVRDIKIHPDKEIIHPGHEIRCSAKGNPTPVIALQPEGDMPSSGAGWRAMIVKESWIGEEMKVTCTASNTIDTHPETLSEERIYIVQAAQKNHGKNENHNENNHLNNNNNHGSNGHQEPNPVIKGDKGTGSNMAYHMTLSLLSLLLSLLIVF